MYTVNHVSRWLLISCDSHHFDVSMKHTLSLARLSLCLSTSMWRRFLAHKSCFALVFHFTYRHLHLLSIFHLTGSIFVGWTTTSHLIILPATTSLFSPLLSPLFFLFLYKKICWEEEREKKAKEKKCSLLTLHFSFTSDAQMLACCDCSLPGGVIFLPTLLPHLSHTVR